MWVLPHYSHKRGQRGPSPVCFRALLVDKERGGKIGRGHQGFPEQPLCARYRAGRSVRIVL